MLRQIKCYKACDLNRCVPSDTVFIEQVLVVVMTLPPLMMYDRGLIYVREGYFCLAYVKAEDSCILSCIVVFLSVVGKKTKHIYSSTILSVNFKLKASKSFDI